MNRNSYFPVADKEALPDLNNEWGTAIWRCHCGSHRISASDRIMTTENTDSRRRYAGTFLAMECLACGDSFTYVGSGIEAEGNPLPDSLVARAEIIRVFQAIGIDVTEAMDNVQQNE
ncbi:MAG: hypothetical protein ACXABN_16985 [Candidatus Thorarchaeota archaeon]|jgi:hypothetical protein